MSAIEAENMAEEPWTTRARADLRSLRGPAGAWAYRAGGAPCAEPTALAALALIASGGTDASDAPVIAAASDWLASGQRPDGSIGIEGAGASATWMTPYAMLLWSTVGQHEEPRRRAACWLLKLKGRTLDPRDDPLRIAGHDTTLVGWPWVADTHSWLEPTCLAILALGREGYAEHPRVVEGLRLVRNRALDAGGWNYGNKSVFGRELRPQPAPTGLALLTLAGIGATSPMIANAVRYLRETLPGVRAAASLGWGLMGLRAWGETITSGDDWLSESFARAQGRPDAAPKLACLLLGASEASLGLFGRSELRHGS
jgi:hypothetical protein